MMMTTLGNTLKGIITVFLLFSSYVHAGDVAVIVNSSNPEALNIEQIKNIYSDRMTTWRSGKKIDLYNLPESQDAREVFTQKVLGMTSRAAVAAEARRRTNNTLKNPSRTKRERLIVSIVSRKKNAIGYVPEYLVKDKKNVRIVTVLKEK